MRQNLMFKPAILIAATTLTSGLNAPIQATELQPPLYKPSSRSAEAIDISSNEYGASTMAPTALNIGEMAPDFHLAISGGGTYSSNSTATLHSEAKPLAIVFYRGHW